MKYKHSRAKIKQVFANLPFWRDEDYTPEDGLKFIDMLLAKEQGEVYKAKGKTFDEQLDYAMGGIVAKEQGEKKPKLKHAYFTSPIFKEDIKPTPPLKEDRKEIEKLGECFNLKDKINEMIEVINHLSSKEK